jgi:hypothetical protein
VVVTRTVTRSRADAKACPGASPLEEAAPDDLAYVRTQLSADDDPLFRR